MFVCNKEFEDTVFTSGSNASVWNNNAARLLPRAQHLKAVRHCVSKLEYL